MRRSFLLFFFLAGKIGEKSMSLSIGHLILKGRHWSQKVLINFVIGVFDFLETEMFGKKGKTNYIFQMKMYKKYTYSNYIRIKNRKNLLFQRTDPTFVFWRVFPRSIKCAWLFQWNHTKIYRSKSSNSQITYIRFSGLKIRNRKYLLLRRTEPPSCFDEFFPVFVERAWNSKINIEGHNWVEHYAKKEHIVCSIFFWYRQMYL